MKALSGDISYLAFVPSVSSQPGDKYGYNILQWFCQGNNLELVSKELNHFGVIAGLFRQIGGHTG